MQLSLLTLFLCEALLPLARASLAPKLRLRTLRLKVQALSPGSGNASEVAVVPGNATAATAARGLVATGVMKPLTRTRTLWHGGVPGAKPKKTRIRTRNVPCSKDGKVATCVEEEEQTYYYP